MGAKVSTIRLQVGERIETFGAEHAERLLRMPNNGGWKIADDEKVELTENGFRPIKHKKGDSSAEQKGCDTEGGSAARVD
jgi:hypothetical protein